MTREEAVKLYEDHGRHGSKAAVAAGMARTTFMELVRGRHNTGAPGGPRHANPTGAALGKSLAMFRETYDKNVIVPKRIREGLAKLGGSWEYEVVFAKACGVSITDISNFRGQFPDNWHALTREGRKVWSSKATIKAIRDML